MIMSTPRIEINGAIKYLKLFGQYFKIKSMYEAFFIY